jgi:hypothetical protein
MMALSYVPPPPNLDHDDDDAANEEFSIVIGGPLYQFYLRSHLARRELKWLPRRLILIPLIVWFPLLIFSVIDGLAIGHSVKLPFLHDIAVQAKYLIALPLFIAAETLVHRALGPVVQQFEKRAIIRDEDRDRFRRIVSSSLRLRNSVVVEILLIAVVYTAGHALWRQNIPADASTWFAIQTDRGVQLTKAGWWYGFVSAPILQFLLLRWYFRLAVWATFLWRVSRMRLHLVPIHPDGAAGLGFLNEALYAFGLLPFAQGVMMSSMIADRIFHFGDKLPSFKGEIATLLVVMLLIFLGPLAVFARQLWRTKIAGLRNYGNLGSSYVIEFDRKWLHRGAKPDEELVGSSDIQSLADLSGSYEIVRGMRATPFGWDSLVFVALTTAAPIVPLVLTMIPLEELIKKVAGALF